MAQMPIPADWDGVSTKCYLIEWPDSVLYQAILVGLISTPTRGRFWDARTGVITDAQSIGKQFFESFNLINGLGGLGMSCLEEIVAQLQCICLAIQASGLSHGSGGMGLYSNGPSSFVDNGTDFPDGYEDRAEYDTAKCNLSQFVINRWLKDLDSIRQVEVAGQAAETLAQVLTLVILTPIPFDDILLLVSGFLALAALGIGVFVTAIDEIIARLEGMSICEIYSAASAEEAIDNVTAWLADETYSQQILTEAVIFLLFGVDSVNVAFDAKSGQINYATLPTGDCSECAPAGYAVVGLSGTVVTYIGDDVWELESVYYGPWSRHATFAAFQNTPSGTPRDVLIVDYSHQSGPTPDEWGVDGVNWNSFPIPDDVEYQSNIVTTTTFPQATQFVIRLTVNPNP